MKKVNDIINDSNVNKDILINDNIVSASKFKYILDKSKFTPNTGESQLAEEISEKLDDQNYACFLDVVNKIGCSEARRLLAVVLSNIREKEHTRTPVRNYGAYFMWIYRKRLY